MGHNAPSVGSGRWQAFVLAAVALLSLAPTARADEPPEYRLKAAFVYNFALFTEWPVAVGATLNLCVLGADPFGKEIDVLRGKAVGARSLVVQRKSVRDSLDECQIVFVSTSVMSTLANTLERLDGRPVLTLADSAGAAQGGVALNMAVTQNKVSFEANLVAARGAGLKLSSKLLRLATEVIQ